MKKSEVQRGKFYVTASGKIGKVVTRLQGDTVYFITYALRHSRIVRTLGGNHNTLRSFLERSYKATNRP